MPKRESFLNDLTYENRSQKQSKEFQHIIPHKKKHIKKIKLTPAY